MKAILMRVNGHSHRVMSMIEKERRKREKQTVILEREGRANLPMSISRNIIVLGWLTCDTS